MSHTVNSNITISKRLTELPDQHIQRMAEIVVHYFPDQRLMEETLRNHLKQAGTVRLAWRQDRIVGFSVATGYKMLTPFYPKPTNVIYQRMLYLDPEHLYRGLGLRLLSVTLKDLFGWLWPFKRLVCICRTQNPVVARIMDMYNVSYPQHQQPVPQEVRKFGESLLPILGADSLDEQCRLVGTLTAFAGRDYTEIWNRFLHRRNNKYEALMLNSAFKEENGRILNSGAFVLMIAYAKPLRFIRYLI